MSTEPSKHAVDAAVKCIGWILPDNDPPTDGDIEGCNKFVQEAIDAACAPLLSEIERLKMYQQSTVNLVGEVQAKDKRIAELELMKKYWCQDSVSDENEFKALCIKYGHKPSEQFDEWENATLPQLGEFLCVIIEQRDKRIAELAEENRRFREHTSSVGVLTEMQLKEAQQRIAELEAQNKELSDALAIERPVPGPWPWPLDKDKPS